MNDTELDTIEEEAAACRKAFEGVEVGAPVWLCHHDILMELLSDPADIRINHILNCKDTGEQARRLREFRPVHGRLPAEWSKANAEWSKANAEWNKPYAEWSRVYAEWSKIRAEWSKIRAECDKANAEWNKAYAEWSKAYAECMPELTALHLAECPDTAWNGTTIFA